MNLDMVPPKNETRNLLLSITKSCELLIEQTQRKPQKTVEFKLTKSTEIFSFKPPTSIEECSMTGMTILEI